MNMAGKFLPSMVGKECCAPVVIQRSMLSNKLQQVREVAIYQADSFVGQIAKGSFVGSYRCSAKNKCVYQHATTGDTVADIWKNDIPAVTDKTGYLVERDTTILETYMLVGQGINLPFQVFVLTSACYHDIKLGVSDLFG